MDHLAEAEKELKTSFSLSPHAPEATLALLAAQTHALIAIGYALTTLADCATINPGHQYNILHISADHVEGVY